MGVAARNGGCRGFLGSRRRRRRTRRRSFFRGPADGAVRLLLVPLFSRVLRIGGRVSRPRGLLIGDGAAAESRGLCQSIARGAIDASAARFRHPDVPDPSSSKSHADSCTFPRSLVLLANSLDVITPAVGRRAGQGTQDARFPPRRSTNGRPEDHQRANELTRLSGTG